MATRWGIVSSGKVAQDFVTAVQLLPASDHQIAAVAARSLDSAQKFADRFSVPRVYGSYAELAADPDLDVVYIGTLHPQHYEVSKMMMLAGKNVLCEKPLALNSRQAEEIIQLAKKQNVFFMEGFWSRCFPAYYKLREALKAGTIGEPRIVMASMGFANAHLTRLTEKSLGGGALMDLGCYLNQISNLVFGKPESINATCTLNEQECDDTTVITFRYPKQQVASLICSVSTPLPNVATIIGTKGSIELPLFWCAAEITINGVRECFPLPETKNPFHFPNSAGFNYEAQHVRELLLQGAKESPLIPHATSLELIKILDEARRQLGVVYDVD